MSEKLRIIDRYDCLIYDFNGTLFDDVSLGMVAVNPMLRRRGLPEIPDLCRYYQLFGFPIEDYYRRLGFDFEKEPFSKLAVEWVQNYREAEKNATLREGATDLLSAVQGAGITQYVLSATEEDMLREQLANLGILSFFREVVGREDIYAESKLLLAENFRKTHTFSRALYIGDTDHDAACAHEIGADCLLLTGGHQSRTDLLRLGLPLFDSLSEMMTYLFSFDEK